MGEDDGHLQEISLVIDLAYLGIILLGYLALFGNQEKERIFYFYNIRKAACKTWAFCVGSPAIVMSSTDSMFSAAAGTITNAEKWNLTYS